MLVPTYTQRISLHGTPFLVQLGDVQVDGKPVKLAEGNRRMVRTGAKAAQHLTRLIRPETKHITLHCCYSAFGGPISTAQILADYTGRRVTGYTGRVSNLAGKPVAFSPRKNGVKKVCNGIKLILGHIEKPLIRPFYKT